MQDSKKMLAMTYIAFAVCMLYGISQTSYFQKQESVKVAHL